MPKKTLYMETTEVPAERTASEVARELIQAGATQIATSYADGKVIGLRWTMKVNGIDALFEMPARVDPVYEILKSRNRSTWLSEKERLRMREKAERVAWRQLLRWVQAQNAMLETGMVQPLEVFTAYWIPPGQERTLFQTMMEQQFKALPAPESTQ
jgi:cation transport regulator ChaC